MKTLRILHGHPGLYPGASMILQVLLLAATLFGQRVRAGDGKIVVSADDWVLSDTAFIEAGETNTGRFAGNVARWFVPEGSTPAIVWTCIATNVAGANGGWEYIETDRSRPAAFYTFSVP